MSHMKRTFLSMAVFCLFALCFPWFAEASKPVVFVDFSWESVQVHNRIAAYIMEKGYGKKTDFIFAESLPGMMGIERGDADLSMEGWVDNFMEYWTRALEKGNIQSLGTNFPDAPQGWYVPTYMIEGDEKRGIKAVAPDLRSVKDLPRYWKLFKDPENPRKGRLYNGPTGWQISSTNVAKIKAYGLSDTYEAFSPGSQTALSTAIKRAYDRGKPILAYYWEPTWVMGLLDMTRLEEPPFDEAVWRDKNDQGCACPSATVYVVANTKFVERSPRLAEFLRSTPTLEQNNKILAYMYSNRVDAREDLWFIKNHRDVWKVAPRGYLASRVWDSFREDKVTWRGLPAEAIVVRNLWQVFPEGGHLHLTADVMDKQRVRRWQATIRWWP